MESDFLKFPAPYFGGKSMVSDTVWAALGNPAHYIEPFAGSGAVLLARPGYRPGMTESINDKDGFVCNVWRALQFSPDETARWCDWPVNHADLMARKSALIKNEGKLLAGLAGNEKWHDPVMAGYWIWAASCWIGSGLIRPGQIPHISHGGMGVHALGQIPHISHGGMGVHALGQIPHISDGGKEYPPGVFNTNIYDWFRTLSERLRYVRVVCGDWERVCGGNWQDKMGVCGIFFDPPYGVEDRDTKIYHHDSTTVAGDVMAWSRERGKLESYRIILAGYEEYLELEKEGWRMESWTAGKGYSSTDNQNRKRERLYFSPHCIAPEQISLEL